MAIVTKGTYWRRAKFNTKTGLFKGETSFSTCDGFSRDWMGKPVDKKTDRKSLISSLGRNGWDD